MIISIGGLSRSGKSKLAKRIRPWFVKGRVILLHQDDYVKPESEIPKVRDHVDWEVPESVDLMAWSSAIHSAREKCDVLIVEGIFAFAFPKLNQIFDRCIYTEISQELFVERKKQDLRWGKEPDWYIAYIWEAHQLHGLPPEELQAYKIAGNRPLDEERVKAYLGITYVSK